MTQINSGAAGAVDLETEAREATVALQEAASEVGGLVGTLAQTANTCRDEVDEAFERLLETASELRRREAMIAALGEEAMLARQDAIRRERAAAELGDEALQVAIAMRAQAEEADKRHGEAIAELQSRLATDDGDHDQLLEELELVRSNLAAMSAELDEERRRFAQQTQAWEARCAEAEEQLAVAQTAAPTRVAAEAPAPPPAPPQPAVVRTDSDPVLGPLMQQFELLQRTRRRGGEMAGAN